MLRGKQLFLLLSLNWAVSSANIEPAATTVPSSHAAGAPLQAAETLQLTDGVIDRIASDDTTAEYAEYFAFPNSRISSNGRLARRAASARCKTFPGDAHWPKQIIWDIFNLLLGGALIPAKPSAASCYDSQWGPKDAGKCANVLANFRTPLFHTEDPTSIMWPIFQGRTCMPPNVNSAGPSCTRGGFPEYAVNVSNVAQIQLAINFARAANIRLVIKNSGHDYLGKSTGAGALSLWMRNLRDIDFLPDYEGPGYSGPALKLAAGVSVREVYEAADRNGVTVPGAISWSVGYAGGMITGGGQNPLSAIYGMAADHVVAFQVVTAEGRYITVSESSHSDLFWALRGGGGGTFAVVVSVIVRAHPKLNVVTANWMLDSSRNGEDKYWAAIRKFFEVFTDWTDSKIYSFFFLTKASLTMTYLFAPNHTAETYAATVAQFFSFLEENNTTLTNPHRYTPHTSFYSGYQATWGSNAFNGSVGTDTSLPANHIIPRRNFKQKFNQTYALIEEHVKAGRHWLGFHNAPVRNGNTNNAVHPAWRECVFFLVTSSNRTADHSTQEALRIQNADLQENILEPWRKVAPLSEGGGTYLNEASVEEPDWQDSFYGGYYPRLSEIKRRWDPKDVFYAVTAVGSERWVVEDGERGVQTQNGRLCRV
ncbi:FAD-binding domain-containing protein [Sporormia fimetaria CBS 119925]|uniref:FAD-binding domain-containing protein n=1 Tax=Sporormia fimetaria CBS 119925 TaxID=1340428 RepID=A0A6A6V6J0_9PLEO|nr:FAD-binding domain-containing protein [Sporormia fimetaria CBS 119925]